MAEDKLPVYAGNWEALNDVLVAAHNPDGTLLPAAVQTALGGSLPSVADVVISSDTGATGTGDVILKTKGAIERLRLKNAGDLLFTAASDALAKWAAEFADKLAKAGADQATPER